MMPWGEPRRLDSMMVEDYRATFLTTENGLRTLVSIGEELGFFSDEILEGDDGVAHYRGMQEYKRILVRCGLWQSPNAPFIIRDLKHEGPWHVRFYHWLLSLRDRHGMKLDKEDKRNE